MENYMFSYAVVSSDGNFITPTLCKVEYYNTY